MYKYTSNARRRRRTTVELYYAVVNVYAGIGGFRDTYLGRQVVTRAESGYVVSLHGVCGAVRALLARGLGQSPSRNRIRYHFSLKI